MSCGLVLWLFVGGAICGYTAAHYQFTHRKASHNDPP